MPNTNNKRKRASTSPGKNNKKQKVDDKKITARIGGKGAGWKFNGSDLEPEELQKRYKYAEENELNPITGRTLGKKEDVPNLESFLESFQEHESSSSNSDDKEEQEENNGEIDPPDSPKVGTPAPDQEETQAQIIERLQAEVAEKDEIIKEKDEEKKKEELKRYTDIPAKFDYKTLFEKKGQKIIDFLSLYYGEEKAEYGEEKAESVHLLPMAINTILLTDETFKRPKSAKLVLIKHMGPFTVTNFNSPGKVLEALKEDYGYTEIPHKKSTTVLIDFNDPKEFKPAKIQKKEAKPTKE